MKISINSFRARARQRGWALLAVMSLAACGLMVLAGVMNWSNENAERTERKNEYFATSYAAEGATEKVYASLSQQYENYGYSLVAQNIGTYQTTLPTSADGAYWNDYQFSGGAVVNQVIVTNTATGVQIVLGGVNAGLTMMANTFEIIANAQNINSQYQIVSTVGQQFYLGTIPLFQFAIFYQKDMEIAPGAAMTVGGPVHGNGSIYLDPQAGLTFSNTVSAVGTNYLHQSPLDPSSRTFSWVNFDSYELNGVTPLNLPVGTNTASTNNVSQNVYAILQQPTAGQTPNSSTGTNILYNKADMIIIISNNNSISVTSGAGINSQGTTITNWSTFLSTNGTFYDQRDSLNVNPVTLNVSNLVSWSATNNVLRPVLSSARGSAAADVQSIYIADLRSTSNSAVTTNTFSGTNYVTNAAVTTAGFPAAGTYAPPITSTNTTSTTTSGYPSPNTYLGVVGTNTTSASNSVAPSAGTYVGVISTNTGSVTTSSHPSSGTYVPPITTNTTVTTTSSLPGANTYTGTITTNKSHGVTTGYTYNLITGYTYTAIIGYTYSAISSYTYNLITGYTYHSITSTPYTNTTYTTNWTVTSQPGIVLSNGSILPPQGLAIATPDPAYIIGNWNVKTNNGGPSDAGSADTSYTHPSAIFADAINVLSSAWNPANSAAALSSRVATSDTVNAAFLTGNVPSNGSYYSGGVENFPRFLENWSGQTFTYNGSMVCMFASQIATSPWPGTGSVYNPPTRTWAFDNNFSNPAKQPPMTPQVLTLQRNQWVLLKPFTTSF